MQGLLRTLVRITTPACMDYRALSLCFSEEALAHNQSRAQAKAQTLKASMPLRESRRRRATPRVEHAAQTVEGSDAGLARAFLFGLPCVS